MHIFWCQRSHNIPMSVFCTVKLLVFEISTPDAQIRLLRLDDWCIHTTWVCLTRAAHETEEGPKEGKRKRSHSFQVKEAEVENGMFQGKVCQSRQTTIVQKMVGRGALEHVHMMRRGFSWKSGREIRIFAKLRHIGWGFDKEALWWSES